MTESDYLSLPLVKVPIRSLIVGQNLLELNIVFEDSLSCRSCFYSLSVNNKEIGLRDSKFSEAMRRLWEYKQVLEAIY